MYYEKRDKKLDKDLIERMKMSGIRSFLAIVKRTKYRVVYVPNRCQFLSVKNKCQLHGRKKPLMCKRFPDRSKCYIMPDGCIFAGKKEGWYQMKDFKEEFL